MLGTFDHGLLIAGGETGMYVVVICLLILYVMLGAVPGIIAEGRKHSKAQAIKVCGWLGWFFTFGILWLVAIVWAFTEDNRDGTQRGGRSDTSLKTCPWCAEKIQSAAVVCKHCGRDVKGGTGPAPVKTGPAAESNTLRTGPAPESDAQLFEAYQIRPRWKVTGVIEGGKKASATLEADSREAAHERAARRFVEIHNIERL